MLHAEPPSLNLCSKTSLFLIGRDRQGHWVVRDLKGLRGGLFVGRTEALKYALFENGNRPHLVVTIPGTFDLDLSVNAFPAPAPRTEAQAQPLAA
jgi:hypothetical protein